MQLVFFAVDAADGVTAFYVFDLHTRAWRRSTCRLSGFTAARTCGFAGAAALVTSPLRQRS